METTAEKVADLANDDPDICTRTLGFSCICRIAGGFDCKIERRGYLVRFTYQDGSSIVAVGAAWGYGWDISYPDCWCWRGSGHHGDCCNYDPQSGR